MAERALTLNPLAKLFANIFSGPKVESSQKVIEKLPPSPILEPQKTATLAWNLHLQTVAMRMYLIPFNELTPEQKNRAIEEAKKSRPDTFKYMREENNN